MSARPRVVAVHDWGELCERLRRKSSTQLMILDIDLKAWTDKGWELHTANEHFFDSGALQYLMYCFTWRKPG